MIFAQLMHTMNVTCAIGGAVYGTGRLMKDLTPQGMVMALRVRYTLLKEDIFLTGFWEKLVTTDLTLTCTVLVDMLSVLLPHHDRRQSLRRPLPPPPHSHYQTHLPHHHSHRRLYNRYYWCRLRSPHNFSVQSRAVLLEPCAWRHGEMH